MSGRRINDGMGKYVAENCVKNLIAADKPVRGAKVAILGFTFKENCPDTRNSKVWDIVNELKEYGINPIISDPVADALEAKRIYGVEFADMGSIKDMDAIVLAVAHDEFKSLKKADIDKLYGVGRKVLLDVKGVLKPQDYSDYSFWRL